VKAGQVSVTSRDLRLLQDLAFWGVLSFSQIRQRHFAGLSLSVMSERLTKLHQAGLLRKQRVGILFHHGRPQEIGTVVVSTNRGLSILNSVGLASHIVQRPKPINTAQLHHELLLVDTATNLLRTDPGSKVFRGSHLVGAAKNLDRLPDLIIKNSHGMIAVELELTAKSSMRYREILASYRVSAQFHKVIYVVSEPSIARKIRGLLGSNPTTSNSLGEVEKFSFVHLSALLEKEIRIV